MKKTFKKPMIVFFILSLVFTVGWAVGFVLYWAGLLNFDFGAFFASFAERFMGFIPLFTGQLYGWAFEGGLPSYLTYVAIALSAFSLFLLVFGIVVSIVRKRALYILYALELLVATYAALDLVLFWPSYEPFLYFQVDLATYYINVIYIYVIAVMTLLAYVFMSVTVFVALAHAKRRLQAAKEEVVVEQPKAVASQDVNEAFAGVQNNGPVVIADAKREDYNTMQDFVSEPEEQVAQPEEIVVEEVPASKDAVTKDDLALILKDVVRDIVRDEIARADAVRAEQERAKCDRQGDHSITGATFGGPLVVQYFNGGINGQTGTPNFVPAPAPAPAPKAEPKKEEVKKEEPAPVAEAKPEPTPVVVEEAPAAAEEAKTPIIRIPFTERMLDAEKDMQDNYNELKNEILSYGVNSRVSNSGDTFRLHRKTYVKLTIAGKSLKLYFALNPADYADSKMPIGDASQHAVYAEIPLIFKVKSGLSVRRAKELIRDVMTPDGLVQGEVGSVNWVKELRAEAKKAKK